jgi:hypothetical protein
MIAECLQTDCNILGGNKKNLTHALLLYSGWFMNLKSHVILTGGNTLN